MVAEYESKTAVRSEPAGQVDHIDHAPGLDHVVFNAHDAEVAAGEVLALVDTADMSRIGDLKLAKDHHTVLFPQPSSSPHDPLNWSWMRKHALLASLCLGSFQCDFTAGIISAVVLQGAEWNLSPNKVNEASSLNILMIGIGGFIWIPFINFWGRAPVLFWTALLGFAFTLGCAVAPNFSTYYAMRGLQSTFQSSYLSVGLACITDVFFFHEHARKIGIWIACVLTAPYFGPIFSNFMLYYLVEWRPVTWMITAVSGLNLVLTPFLIDESFYNRNIPAESQPHRGNKISRILGIWQIRNHSYFMPVGTAFLRYLKVCLKPLVILSFIYFLLAYMWFIGTGIAAPILLQTPPSYGGYGFSNKAVACMYFAPLVGVLLGESFGHFFNDWLALSYIKKHKGVFVPEVRLKASFLATVFMVPGLILLGQVLGKHLHWVGIAFGWGMYTFGACVTAVALFAYLSDSYPTASGECSAILNLSRCMGGFAVGYFELPWGLKDGYPVSFGVQAALVVSSVFFLIGFMFFGKALRRWGGPVEH
ncbi:hypothetical protein AYO21_00461 [Fonsecaea monophora]|uniref:Major facilitator superfamily (MFS) profile domain-containing protein n=1 Tax=Fonsecaea monophora TaxID=254056 RepID=A0A177FLB9_9EURO|nr:hypothetical protein AYO21_00461 [Fonsecaea monophora]OAG45113.1 hypothetical protein AYO21_00461 [Fonsecaea monophora]